MNTLDRIRILQPSRMLASPWCTQNLADLGANHLMHGLDDGKVPGRTNNARLNIVSSRCLRSRRTNRGQTQHTTWAVTTTDHWPISAQ